MKKIIQLFAFIICTSTFSQTPVYNANAYLKFFNFSVNGENRLDYSGNQSINLRVTSGMSNINFGITNSNFTVKISLYGKLPSSSPILLANDDNVVVNNGAFISSVKKDFFITLNKSSFPVGSVLYCIVERSGGAYSFQSRDYTITDCIQTAAPTNITAIPYYNGYTIGFSPAGAYFMEYLDLVTNTSGTTQLYTSSSPGSGNFFYFSPQNNSFKFRLRSSSSPCSLFSNWITYDTSNSNCALLPENLTLTSQCGNQNKPSVCGAYVRWDNVANAIAYEFEYLIFNTITGQTRTGIQGCPSNSFNISGDYVSGNSWLAKFRVKTKCTNGMWSPYSPWSGNYIW